MENGIVRKPNFGISFPLVVSSIVSVVDNFFSHEILLFSYNFFFHHSFLCEIFLFSHATMNTKWWTFPQETLFNAIQSRVSMKCGEEVNWEWEGGRMRNNVLKWSNFLSVLFDERNETKKKNWGTMRAADSNFSMFMTLMRSSNWTRYWWYGVADLHRTWCECNRIVCVCFSILYLLIVCNRDDNCIEKLNCQRAQIWLAFAKTHRHPGVNKKNIDVGETSKSLNTTQVVCLQSKRISIWKRREKKLF